MKATYLILIIAFGVACSSAPVRKINKDLDDIEKDDFKQPTKVKYTRASDRLIGVDSEYSQALNSESLQRVYKYDGDFNAKDELSNIIRYCYQNKFKEAYTVVRNNGKKYINNPIFWNHVGTCYLLQGERRKALLFLNKSLSMRKNYGPALNNLGVMYIAEGDFPRAMVAFEKALKSKEFSLTPRYNLANLYLNFGLFSETKKHLKVLKNASKTDVDVLNMQGVTSLMQNDSKKAISYFQQIDSDFLELPRFGLNYALALYSNNQKREAKDIYISINNKELGDWRRYYKSVGKTIGAK